MSGIENIILNCFISSSLQLILSSKKISLLFEKEPYKEFLDKYHRETILNPRSVVLHYFSLNKFAVMGRQGDSHEVLVYFLDDLPNTDMYNVKLKNNIIHNGVFLRSSDCNTNIISVTKCSTLQESIDSLFHEGDEFEFVDDVGDDKVNKTIKMQITPMNAPEFLFVHVKRTNYNPELDTYIKDNSPMEIDSEISFNNNNYDIVGFIIHTGTYQSGHYFTVSKRGDKWYKFDDNSVYELFNRNVSEYAKLAYIFLLKRRDVIDDGLIITPKEEKNIRDLVFSTLQKLERKKNEIVTIDNINNSLNIIMQLENLVKVNKLAIDGDHLNDIKSFFLLKKYQIESPDILILQPKFEIDVDLSSYKTINNKDIKEYMQKYYKVLTQRKRTSDVSFIDNVLVDFFTTILYSLVKESVRRVINLCKDGNNVFNKNDIIPVIYDIIDYNDTERDIIIYDIIDYLKLNRNESLMNVIKNYSKIHTFIILLIENIVPSDVRSIIDERSTFFNNIITAVDENKSIQEILIDDDYVDLINGEIDYL